MDLWGLLCYVKLVKHTFQLKKVFTKSLLKASLGRDSVKIYILTIVTIVYSSTKGIPYCKSSLWISCLVFSHIACLIITVEPLSTRPVFLVDNPYIDSCLNLSTKTTFYCPQGGHCGEVQLHLLKSSLRILVHPCRVSFWTCDSKHQRFVLDSCNGGPTGHRSRILD